MGDDDDQDARRTELGQDPSGHTVVPPNSDPFGADGARGDGLPDDPAPEPGDAEGADGSAGA